MSLWVSIYSSELWRQFYMFYILHLTEVLFLGFSNIFMTFFFFCLKNTATSLLFVITDAATWTTFLKIKHSDNFHCTILTWRDKMLLMIVTDLHGDRLSRYICDILLRRLQNQIVGNFSLRDQILDSINCPNT